MPRIHHAERALALSTYSPRSQYVCRACRAHVVRQLHTTTPHNAETSFFQRMRNSIFGSKEKSEADKKLEERIGEIAKSDAARSKVKTKRDRKGHVYQVAAVVDSTTHPEYVEATNWEGLRRIGGEKWIKEQKDEGEKYVGFMPQKRAKLDKIDWQKILRHATVEVLALQKAGRTLNEATAGRRSDHTTWQHTQAASIGHDEATGKATVSFETAEAEQSVLAAIPKPTKTPRANEIFKATTLYQTLSRVTGNKAEAWMSIPIKDSLTKLAIAKRVMQLSGHRISDVTLSNAATLQDLYNAVITKEPPQKLAFTRELHELSTGAPNVRVHMRRQTPVHKEKAIGRWKVIEEELIARDLPVTGRRRHARPNLAPVG